MFTAMQSTVNNPINEQQSAKKQKLHNENKDYSSKMEKESSRILGRRYPLTKTGYKYLDIGIRVSTPSHVEIALGDNHGKEIHLSYSVWRELMNQRDIIAHFFENDVSEAPSQIVGHCTLTFGKINNLKVMRLETSTICLIMTSQTACNMFAIEYCIECINNSLNNVTGTVDSKFACFLEIVKNGKKDSPHMAIRKSDAFDKNNIIDCEMVTQVFALL